MTTLLWALMGILAGACIATQAPINAQLGRSLGLPLAAAGISFLFGAVVLWLLTFAFARANNIALDWAAPAPWTFAAGGLLGAAYVFSTVILTPMIGTAAVMGLSVTGQLIAGIALDRAGFMGMPIHDISPGRLAGAALLITGAVMIRLF
ncbi:MAG: hypothetical protein JWR39_617 [Devosia sp.]|jgi:transporter family-2 protein|nr:hypothetical protein [Devosia sp.]